MVFWLSSPTNQQTGAPAWLLTTVVILFHISLTPQIHGRGNEKHLDGAILNSWKNLGPICIGWFHIFQSKQSFHGFKEIRLSGFRGKFFLLLGPALIFYRGI